MYQKQVLTTLFMAALCNRAGHIYFHPVVSSSFFFDRQDRQQSDSIERTVLQTVAQKPTVSVLQCCCKVNNTTGAKYKYNTVLIRMKFSTIGLIYTTKC